MLNLTRHRTVEIDGVDMFYREAGAAGAELHLLDSGHFALEDKGDQILPLLRDFLGRHLHA